MLYLFFFLVILAFLYIFLWKRDRYLTKTPWQHFFDGFEFSAEQLYADVQSGLTNRKIPNISCTTENFIQTHILSDRRKYLRITSNEYVFYIGCSHYGTGTFVSEWLCVKKENFLNRIPLLSKLMGTDRDDKTFYQMDTEAMFRMAIHSTVLEILDNLTTAKGIRGLTELERQYIVR